jgi:hypothetical protein
MPNVPMVQKSYWMHLMEWLDNVGHVESHFDPFGDSVTLAQGSCTVSAERTIGSEILLDAPDGTPR